MYEVPKARWFAALSCAVLVSSITGCGARGGGVTAPPNAQNRALVKANDPTTNLYATSVSASLVTRYHLPLSGNEAPNAIISGFPSELNAPTAVAVDSAGKIYIANFGDNSVRVYPPTANGNQSPLSTICRSQLDGPEGIALDTIGNVYVANEGNSTVTVYAAGSNGTDIAPMAIIGGPDTGLSRPFGIAVDLQGDVYVANPGAASITVYSAGANGDVHPVRAIQGPHTGILGTPGGVALDSAGRIYVTSRDSATSSDAVTVYARGATGDVAPVATIAGPDTQLFDILGIAVDSTGDIFVADLNGNITEYPPNSNGDVAPIGKLSSIPLLGSLGEIAVH